MYHVKYTLPLQKKIDQIAIEYAVYGLFSVISGVVSLDYIAKSAISRF